MSKDKEAAATAYGELRDLVRGVAQGEAALDTLVRYQGELRRKNSALVAENETKASSLSSLSGALAQAEAERASWKKSAEQATARIKTLEAELERAQRLAAAMLTLDTDAEVEDLSAFIVVSWQHLEGREYEDYTDHEKHAVIMHPMCLGLGIQPQTATYSDWLQRNVALLERFGGRVYLHSLLHLLRGTYPVWRSDYPVVKADQPTSRELFAGSEFQPTVAVGPGDPQWDPKKWNAEMVRGVAGNPVLVGIGPYPPTSTDPEWVAVQLLSLHEDGTSLFLTNLVHALRETMGHPDRPYRRMPAGYHSSTAARLLRRRG